MNIYPKTCRNFEGLDKIIKYVEKYKGIELQFFDEQGPMNRFEFESVIDNLVQRVPTIKEITIHPPLNLYDIEYVISKDINIIKEQFELLVKLSRKYNIKMNIIYHTMLNLEGHKALTIDKIKECLKILEGENVTVCIENIFMFFEKKCTAYELAAYIDHPNLKVCFDLCHLYCRAHIDKMDVREYAKKYLDKKLCQKYTYQIHFSYTADNDGYINKYTHGRRHLNIDDLREDVELLKEYNISNCNYITEISEEDYLSRKDQVEELDMLEEVLNKE